MPGSLQPLDQKFAIVDARGNPTDYFIRWAQQKQIDIGDSITLTDLQDYLTAHALIAGTGIGLAPDGNINDSPTITAKVQEILDQITATRGAVLYRGAAGWAALLAGAAGQFLQTAGAGADPLWAAAGGGGAPADKFYGFTNCNFSSSTNAGAGNWIGRPILFTHDCTITNVIAPSQAASATGKLQPGIYSATAAGLANALVASGPAVTGFAAGPNTLPLTTPLVVVAGTILYVGFLITVATYTAANCAGVSGAVYGSGTLLNPAAGVSYGGAPGWSSMWVQLQ